MLCSPIPISYFFCLVSCKQESVEVLITNASNALHELLADVSKQSIMEEVTNYYPIHLVTR